MGVVRSWIPEDQTLDIRLKQGVPAPGVEIRIADLATGEELPWDGVAFGVIQSGGEWISTVELEGAIMAHPKVLEAAVIGLYHSKWQERPVAYVVTKPEFKGQVTALELQEFLADRVAKWWLPDDIRFIDEMPKTSTMKFDKKALRATAEPIAEEAPVQAQGT